MESMQTSITIGGTTYQIEVQNKKVLAALLTTINDTVNHLNVMKRAEAVAEVFIKATGADQSVVLHFINGVRTLTEQHQIPYEGWFDWAIRFCIKQVMVLSKKKVNILLATLYIAVALIVVPIVILIAWGQIDPSILTTINDSRYLALPIIIGLIMFTCMIRAIGSTGVAIYLKFKKMNPEWPSISNEIKIAEPQLQEMSNISKLVEMGSTYLSQNAMASGVTILYLSPVKGEKIVTLSGKVSEPAMFKSMKEVIQKMDPNAKIYNRASSYMGIPAMYSISSSAIQVTLDIDTPNIIPAISLNNRLAYRITINCNDKTIVKTVVKAAVSALGEDPFANINWKVIESFWKVPRQNVLEAWQNIILS
nr:hypothetical protein [Candidatus Sigynarchaeota archaeon]